MPLDAAKFGLPYLHFEVQFHTQASLDSKGVIHPVYQKMRVEKDQAKKVNLLIPRRASTHPGRIVAGSTD